MAEEQLHEQSPMFKGLFKSRLDFKFAYVLRFGSEWRKYRLTDRMNEYLLINAMNFEDWNDYQMI